ncbi:penicillin acylase family protein [Conexibacter sp. SYSU D00693]|uniref:penicillin acylase family protein n=1 Tax=Conexibacter sp. SYSU D00693 TaxID=2812560 RepID=UPI00196A33A8|nr:penicillin acylase family protein [Conexibacter sp. SYSU D00693]
MIWRRVVGVAALVAAGTGLAAPGAQAGVTRAEGVLPPGQSGFVSVPGILQGTGSPHLYDQSPLFSSFKRKPLTFTTADRVAGERERPIPGVQIVRDAYGVPSVTGQSDYDLWWGAGYAVAQDRLFQLEAFRRATQGRLATIQGKSVLEDDLVARRDYYTGPELDAMAARLPVELQRRAEAYRDGINAWLARARLDLTRLPGEFAVLAALPIPDWTLRDTWAVGVFLARTVPSGDGNELNNLRAVQQGGRKVLEELLPLHIKGQRSTIPAGEGRFPQGKAPTARQERRALNRSLEFVKTLPTPSSGQAAAARRKADLAPGRLGRVGGSSMFAVGDRKKKRAWLFNGPQLGFSSPELFVELELHGPGTDVRGVTAPGVPILAIGHNEHVAWGYTSGLSDEDDLYAEKLVPGQPEKYVFQGQERQMECRNETFQYTTTPAALLLDGAAPEFGSKTERICRTVHGPVQVRDGGVAYARRYAIWGRELDTFPGLSALATARSVQDVDKAMRTVTWNENLMAADDQGNIGYWHPGLFQQRPPGWDQRLPMPGTGEAEWPGFVDRSKLPAVINPRQGWLANWNNIPSQGWTTGDGEATERVTGPLHRVGILQKTVARMAKNPSFEAAEAVIRRAGASAQQRTLLGPQLRRIAKKARGGAATVLGTILAWDGDYHRTDEAGKVDAGVAAWKAFRDAAMDAALAPFGPAGRKFGTTTSSSHVYDFSNGMAYAFRTLDDRQLRLAAAAALGRLEDKFGTTDPAGWREPRTMYDVGTQGAAQPDDLPFFDRGTWEQIVELGG